MIVSVAPRSGLLDTDVPIHEKLYGYHRLEDPTLILIDEDGKFFNMGFKEYSRQMEEKQKADGEVIMTVNTPPEAKRY
jgi:hypothetical protein